MDICRDQDEEGILYRDVQLYRQTLAHRRDRSAGIAAAWGKYRDFQKCWLYQIQGRSSWQMCLC